MGATDPFLGIMTLRTCDPQDCHPDEPQDIRSQMRMLWAGERRTYPRRKGREEPPVDFELHVPSHEHYGPVLEPELLVRLYRGISVLLIPCPICLQRLWLIDSDLFTWTHSTRICRIHQLAVNLEISVEGRVDCLLIMVYGGIVVSVM